MTYEELKNKKSNKIKEWLEYLTNNNESDVLWKQKNEVFVSLLLDYLYLIRKEKNDIIINRQYEIIQPVATYINELNREKVYCVAEELKEMEDNTKINLKNINKITKDIENMMNKFNDNSFVINDEEKQKKQILETINDMSKQPKTQNDEDFEKYSKLYEEKFKKKAYITEPSGTREQTINAIKICLERNEDLLDKLLSHNLENDIDNGVLYSEKKQNLINDKFVYRKGDIIFAETQCEYCKYNDKEHPHVCSQYPNGKPNEVINADILCPKLDNKYIIDLEEL